MTTSGFAGRETDRLQLRERVAGAERLVELLAGRRQQANPGTRWGITRKADGMLIGSCGLFMWNRAWRKCVLGYKLAPPA